MGNEFFFLLVLFGFLLFWRGKDGSRKDLLLFTLSAASSPVTMDNAELANNL